MAIFEKQSSAAENLELRIPAKSTFSGDISTNGNARIDGSVEGNVICASGNILLGVDSKIKGNIQGLDVAVGGYVQGDIIAQGQLSIFSGAQVIGNVHAHSFVAEKDSVFRGHVTIGSQEQGETNDLMFLTMNNPQL